ncbi:hypothetical protein ACO0QE_002731 [Hanseniaspora vineae]
MNKTNETPRLVPFVEKKTANIDYKEKQFSSNVEKALQQFDSVDDWADYISRLGKLLKALQSWSPKFQNVSYYVPHPYQVARRLASSLAPNLPAGVHSKTLEVYSIIFDKIGIETLSNQCNIWIPGVLPLMTYATLSVKPQLIEVYEEYILKMNARTLKVLVKPILASLLPGIDEEGSEFQAQVLQLIQTLQEALNNDALFWQSFYLIMIKNKDHRLGGLAWMTKQMPSLNAIPHLATSSDEKNTQKEKNSTSTREDVSTKEQRKAALELLLPSAKPLVSLEVGLLIRCLVACLSNDNEVIIQRGILDLILQRVHLDSPVLETLIFPSEKEMLVMACCEQLLKKDMSLNRRIWSWFLKPSSKNEEAPDQQYFVDHCLDTLIRGLHNYIKNGRVADALKISQILMHKWEIGSLVTERMFLPLTKASIGENEKTVLAASEYFDSIDTKLIWNSILSTLLKNDHSVLNFVLDNYHLENEEEMVVKHLPMIFLELLVLPQQRDYSLLMKLIRLIPGRAYLLEPQGASPNSLPNDEEIAAEIFEYYSNDNAMSPFSPITLTHIILSKLHALLLSSLETGKNVTESIDLFVTLYSLLPEAELMTDFDYNKISDRLVEAKYRIGEDDCLTIIPLSNLFVAILLSKIDTPNMIKNLRFLFQRLWVLLTNPSKQLEALQALENLQRVVPQKYMEASIVSVFMEEKEITKKLLVMNGLWTQSNKTSIVTNTSTSNYSLAAKPLELILDELADESKSEYLYAKKWLLNILEDTKSANRIFEIYAWNLLNFGFINKKEEFEEFDNIDIFTYYVNTLINVLNCSDGQSLALLNSELTSSSCANLFLSTSKDKKVNISTYKNLFVAILLNFLCIKSNKNSRSVRVVLKFLHMVLNGSEYNFKSIVSLFLDLSSSYIQKSSNHETDLIIVALLDIVSNVLSLSQKQNIKLEIFDNSQSHLKYVDFLVSSVLLIQKPSIMNAYVKLLTESILYFREAVFNIILPLISAMVASVESLYSEEYGTYENYDNYLSVCSLLDGIEELLQVSHSYMSVSLSHLNGGNKSDFLSNVVSNVFSGGSTYSASGSNGSPESNRILVNRQVVVQSFAATIKCCFRIWKSCNSYEQDLDRDKMYSLSLYQQSCKYKYKSRKLLEKLYLLEPVESSQCLLDITNEPASIHSIYKLVYALDGNRPTLTLPHFFRMCVYKHNPGSTLLTQDFKVKMSTSSSFYHVNSALLMDFVLIYVANLEFSAVEDINTEFLQFAKEVVGNASAYENISVKFLELVATVCYKMGHCQFGDDKRLRKEYSDLFTKYLGSLDYNLVQLKNKDVYRESLQKCVQYTEHIVADAKFSEKYNLLLSSLVGTFVAPFMKKINANSSINTEFLPVESITSNDENAKEKSVSKAASKRLSRQNKGNSIDIPNYVAEFMSFIAPLGSKVKPWKAIVSDFFSMPPNDDYSKSSKIFGNAFSNCLFMVDQSSAWRTIIYEWSQYSDNKGKLINELVVNCSAATSNPFGSWSQTEVGTKCLDYFKICYLLLISPKDEHILQFKPLMNEVERVCLNETGDIENEIVCIGFKLLRCMFLKFNSMQFLNNWGSITFILQKNLQMVLESDGKFDIHLVFQIFKTLDMLVTLDFEEFDSTQAWLFIVDSLKGVSSDDYVSLIDLLAQSETALDINVQGSDSASKEKLPSSSSATATTSFTNSSFVSTTAVSTPTPSSLLSMIEKQKMPLLYGKHDAVAQTDLKNFVEIFSYANYESLFNDDGAHYSVEEILEDTLQDLFYSPQFFF